MRGERKERELNPQGTRHARPASNRFPSPVGWSFLVVVFRSAKERDGTSKFKGLGKCQNAKLKKDRVPCFGHFEISTFLRHLVLELRNSVHPRSERRQSRRKARDSNPHLPIGRHALAKRSGNPYPATFHHPSPPQRSHAAAIPRGNESLLSISSSSGGIRTHSIPGSEPGWSPGCLPSHVQSAEAVGLEPTSGPCPPPVFKTGPSSRRMTSSVQFSHCQPIAGGGVEPPLSLYQNDVLPLHHRAENASTPSRAGRRTS